MLNNANGSDVEAKTGRRLTKAARDQALGACLKSSTVHIQANRAKRAASDSDLIAFLRWNWGFGRY